MKISRCKICDSKFHLGTRCPKRNDTRETIFIEEMIVSLLAESFNVAIIDLACTKTVCGEVWMQYYTDSLSVSDKDKINICKSSNSFKFGKINSRCHWLWDTFIAKQRFYGKGTCNDWL